MNARSLLFLIFCLYKSFAFNGADINFYRGYERQHAISRFNLNVPGGEVHSLVDCGALCARSSSCKAFCYSQSTALCHLSQPYDPIVQQYNGSDFECYNPTGCPMTKGYGWYGARCIKGYAEKKKYNEAKAFCTQDGGHLYHFKDLDWDLQPIVDLLTVDVDLAGSPLWMGADDLEVQGQYKWSDSSLLANDSPVWGPNPWFEETRRHVLLKPDTLRLRNAHASNPQSFVCQIDA